jgi:phage gp36-like protein
MCKTDAAERRNTLKKQSTELTNDAKAAIKASRILLDAQIEAQSLLGAANNYLLKKAESLKLQEWLEDITIYQINKDRETKKVTETYSYWMASWREGNKVRNIHLGSSRKMDAESAKQKAKKLKSEALG